MFITTFIYAYMNKFLCGSGSCGHTDRDTLAKTFIRT